MSRWNIGETKTLIATFYIGNDQEEAPQINFKYKIGSQSPETSIIATHEGLGVYSVKITPETSGNLFYRWDTEGTYDVVKEGIINVAPSVFA